MAAANGGASGGRRAGIQLGALLVAAALCNVAYTILIPFVPTLQHRFGMTPAAIGLTFGAFSATKALAQPLGGWTVDRLCARTVAVAGLLVSAAATAALAGARDTGEVIGYRILWGLGDGFAAPALYRLASALGERDGHEARVLGWFGSAAVVGMALGPGVVAAFADTLTFPAAFALGAALTTGAAVVLWCAVAPDLGRAPARHHGADLPESAPASRPGTWLTVVGFGLLDFVNNFIYAALEPTLPLYATRTLRLDARTVSLLFFVGLAASAAIYAIGGRPVQQHGERAVATIALFVQAAALTAAGASAVAGVLAASFVLLMISQPLVYVAARSGVTAVSGRGQGRAFGLFGLISDLGWVTGPIVVTPLLNTMGGSVLLLLALLAAITGATAWTLAGRRKALRSVVPR
ncbi:uncharacterized protein SOCEGT47_050230 [Sorangium cellulosum]|uniref:Major facilitator superfamily (MFS) profile domain-containing protein n=1 Tax=Sorangium cellulosum TaxID=56 RepID=A0A4P2Q521_SORCE|nr:MFS transporter [Sorangium cellulosum]AUX24485.1 uncharacterized protein SOCEGT47_050230 [Sorangium cellulosum]